MPKKHVPARARHGEPRPVKNHRGAEPREQYARSSRPDDGGGREGDSRRDRPRRDDSRGGHRGGGRSRDEWRDRPGRQRRGRDDRDRRSQWWPDEERPRDGRHEEDRARGEDAERGGRRSGSGQDRGHGRPGRGQWRGGQDRRRSSPWHQGEQAPRPRRNGGWREQDLDGPHVEKASVADRAPAHQLPRTEPLHHQQRRHHRFGELGVPQALVDQLTEQGIESPFPIQQAAIPDALAGRDVLGRGQTGSGKTLAFGLPVIARLSTRGQRSGAPGAVLLAPTRELAMQMHDVLRPLAQTMRLHTVLVAGGMGYAPQLRALERGVDIIVATPGRLIDLIERGAADLGSVQIVVLDEADEMADMGFMPEVTRILDAVPTGAQHLLFSATLDNQVDELVRRYLREPAVHGVDAVQASVTTMRHELLAIAARERAEIVAQAVNRPGRTIVFVRTQVDADETASELRGVGIMAGALHGGLPQGLRARVLHAFREGRIPVLVATDVAARGIDVDDVSLVLQADPPHDAKDYLHRAGRTARAGEDGLVISLVLPRQRRRMARIIHEAGVHARPRPMHAGEELQQLTGGARPEGMPVTEEQYRGIVSPPRPPRGHGGGGRFRHPRRGNSGYRRPRRPREQQS